MGGSGPEAKEGSDLGSRSMESDDEPIPRDSPSFQQ